MEKNRGPEERRSALPVRDSGSGKMMRAMRKTLPFLVVLLVALPAATRTEMSQLRQAGKAEKLAMQERQMKGRVFLFNRERYTLHDGTTVTLSVGEPKDAKQPRPPVAEANQP